MTISRRQASDLPFVLGQRVALLIPHGYVNDALSVRVLNKLGAGVNRWVTMPAGTPGFVEAPPPTQPPGCFDLRIDMPNTPHDLQLIRKVWPQNVILAQLEDGDKDDPPTIWQALLGTNQHTNDEESRP